MTNNFSDGWYFTDNYLPEPYREGTEAFPIQSEEQLTDVLREFSHKEPRILIIDSPTEGQAFVGIGGSVAGVRYYASPSSDHSVAAKPREPCTGKEHWFVSEGEPSRFAAEHLMPVDEVIGIVTYLFRTGGLPDWVDWV